MMPVILSGLGVFHYLSSGWDQSLVLRSDLVDHSADSHGGAFSSSAAPFLYILLHLSHLLSSLAVRLTDSSSSSWNFNSLILIVTPVAIHL
jgi:hypothetical protein